MKTKFTFILLVCATIAGAQSIQGTWQLSEEKTCFQSQLQESSTQSSTEKELSEAMGSTSKTTAARMLVLGEKGAAEEGIFTQGKKKGSSMKAFKYQVSGSELQYLDKKSGIITQRLIIDELTATVLRVHDQARECEIKTYSRVK